MYRCTHTLQYACVCGNFFFTSCSRCVFTLFVCYRPFRNEYNHFCTNNWNISHCICICTVCVILKTKRLKPIHTKPQSKCSCGNEWILLKWIRQRHNTSQYNTMPLRISACTQYIHYFNEILSFSLFFFSSLCSLFVNIYLGMPMFIPSSKASNPPPKTLCILLTVYV